MVKIPEIELQCLSCISTKFVIISHIESHYENKKKQNINRNTINSYMGMQNVWKN